MAHPASTPSIATLAGRWTLDPKESEVRIGHKTFWGLTTVKGRFAVASGEATVDPQGGVTGAVVIDPRSLNTKNKKRDEHLRSADFFDADGHPEITVAVTSASLQGELVTVNASLTIKGRPSPVLLTGQVVQRTGDVVTLTVDGEVDRERFAMTWNRMGMLTGNATVHVSAVLHRG